MTALTVREKRIVMLLIESGDYIPAERISTALQVSKKTVYRDLQSIKEKMGNHLIEQCQGRGYHIHPLAPELSPYIQKPPRENQFAGMNTAERRKHMLILLLFESPKETSINRLADYYFVARASIVNDLAGIETTLPAYQLQLVRSRKGTFIEGKEAAIRRLLKKILGYELDYFQENSHINKETYHYLFKEFSQHDICFVEQLLKDIERRINGNIKDPYYINIFTHLIILIKRLRSHSNLGTDESPLEPPTELKHGQALEAACITIGKIAEHTSLEVPEIEIFYLYQYLISSGIDTPASDFAEEFALKHSKEKQVTLQLIQMISAKLGIDLTADLSLRQSLFLHMQSLMKRVHYDILICNPLLEEIKSEFPAIFQTVRQNLLEQTIFSQFENLNDDEVGYIAVYFQAALEKRTLHKKVMIVCSSGVGTSHLLSARVKRAFPEWEIVDIISANRIGQIEHPEQIDFILTTVQLEAQQIPTILVSAIFSEVDILKVKTLLHAGGC